MKKYENMKNYKRLTYRKGEWVGIHDETNGIVSTNSQAAHRLAELEDKICGGQLVQLPLIIRYSNSVKIVRRDEIYDYIYVTHYMSIHEARAFLESRNELTDTLKEYLK